MKPRHIPFPLGQPPPVFHYRDRSGCMRTHKSVQLNVPLTHANESLTGCNPFPSLLLHLSLSLHQSLCSPLQSSVRSPATVEVAASAGTCAGVRQTRRGSFAICPPRLLPDPPLKATRSPAHRCQNPPTTPCTPCRCPISKVITLRCPQGVLHPPCDHFCYSVLQLTMSTSCLSCRAHFFVAF